MEFELSSWERRGVRCSSLKGSRNHCNGDSQSKRKRQSQRRMNKERAGSREIDHGDGDLEMKESLRHPDSPRGVLHTPHLSVSFCVFQHPTVTRSSSLQRTLSQQAADHSHKASVQHAKAAKTTDDCRSLSHLTAVSAPRAWSWKTVLPTSRDLELSDVQYRLAARLNLALRPEDGVSMAAMPDDCPLCAAVSVSHKSIAADPWHFLSKSSSEVRSAPATMASLSRSAAAP